EGGASAATYWGAVGPAGVTDGAGRRTPVFEALRLLGRFQGQRFWSLRNHSTFAVRGFLVPRLDSTGFDALLVNLEEVPTVIRIEPIVDPVVITAGLGSEEET